MKNSNRNQILNIKKAYDDTVVRYYNGIEDVDLLPDEFKNSIRYSKLKKLLELTSFNSSNSEIKEYLYPQQGMAFLDVGSCVNLIENKLFKWPSVYFGIDISPNLIEISKKFVERNNINIGGLYVEEVARMPFENDFFNICAVIGVLEYYDIKYIRNSLKELYRVLKPDSRMVIDMPNQNHPDVDTMFEFEEYLGRPRYKLPTNGQFELELKQLFIIDKIDDSTLMKVYFVRSKKNFH